MLNSLEIRDWVIRTIKWDGMLPGIVWSAPLLVKFLLPNQRGPVEIAAVVLPIMAFFVRFKVGSRHIATNHCSTGMRRLQITLLCIGILILALIDAVLILTHIMPKGAAFAATGDLVVWAVLYLIYFIAMSTAMYPGVSDRCHARIAQQGKHESGHQS